MKNKVPANKSMEIRRTARQMVLEGKPPRPKEIIARLKDKGIEVLSSQVSTALRGTEFALRQLRPDWNQPSPPEPAEAISQTFYEDLSKAEDFVRKIGSLEKAMAALVSFGLFKKEPETEEYYGGA